MTKLKILEETVEFYSENPRSIGENGFCVYFHEDGRRCAVGRCIDLKKKDQFLEMLDGLVRRKVYAGFSGNALVNAGMIPDLDSFLEEKYKGHSSEFWEEIQQFHDHCANWEVDGELSDYGRYELTRLKRIINEL